jgi:ribosomal protein L7/L12
MTTEQALSLILQFMLSGQSINADALVQQLAKNDPVLLCKLLELNVQSTRFDAMYDALRSSNKVEAIKQLRTTMGLGLKEATDVIDVLMRYDCAPSEYDMSGVSKQALSTVREDLGRDYW